MAPSPASRASERSGPPADGPCRRVDLGTIVLTALDTERERDGDVLVNDPMRVTDGIEPSDDPILRIRPLVYELSVRRRTPAPRAAEAQLQ